MEKCALDTNKLENSAVAVLEQSELALVGGGIGDTVPH